MYKLTRFVEIYKTDEGLFIPQDPKNKDYQEYLKWVQAGNTPAPVDPYTSEQLEKFAKQDKAKQAITENTMDNTIKYLTSHTPQEVETFLLTKFPSLTNPEIKIIARLANAIGALYIDKE